MEESSFQYVGNELDVFSHAHNWKAYWSSLIEKSLGARVLEVGAGFGTNTPLLCGTGREEWVCLEPDGELLKRLERDVLPALPKFCRTFQGTIADLPEDAHYDSAIYIDVLEHIEDDAGELVRALKRIKRGGRIVVLSPAHNLLYSPFDKAIGHYRRYNKTMIRKIVPAGATLETLRYVDMVGLLASLANRLLLKQSLPTEKQIKFWDRNLVTASRRLDPIFDYSLGKSILAIFRKD